jgi:hypothetical protein
VNRAACTIVSPNYLPFARTLAVSYLAQHPGHRFFVLIVADVDDAAPFRHASFTPVTLGEIGLDNLRATAMTYDILELNTNVKPTFLKYLLAAHGLDQLVYLDPDIFVYAPLAPVFDALDAGASVVLTPHMTTPVFDGLHPSEQDQLYNGTFNLGFAAFSSSPESLHVLDWWESRCLDLGFSEGRTGLFVDQKWMNLAPGFFPATCILRHPGCNMAYWNLHERTLTASGASYAVQSPTGPVVPLCFFHFSGVVVADPAVLSKHTNRFTLADRPDLQPLFAAYKAAVQANVKPDVDGLPYGFDAFSDGTTITRLARRLYAMHHASLPPASVEDPFAASSTFARLAKRSGWVKGTLPPPKSTWHEFNPNDRRVRAVHGLLALALRLLGPHRYELLMRYLSHITVLRHQAVFLLKDSDH